MSYLHIKTNRHPSFELEVRPPVQPTRPRTQIRKKPANSAGNERICHVDFPSHNELEVGGTVHTLPVKLTAGPSSLAEEADDEDQDDRCVITMLSFLSPMFYT